VGRQCESDQGTRSLPHRAQVAVKNLFRAVANYRVLDSAQSLQLQSPVVRAQVLQYVLGTLRSLLSIGEWLGR
jgi:hypothetical protein